MTPANGPSLDAIGETAMRAESLAENARIGLVAMLDNRRKERETSLRVIVSYKDKIRSLSRELASEKTISAAHAAAADEAIKNHEFLLQNHKRLYAGFVSLLKSIEETCGAEFGVDQRIEATLLSADIGNGIGEHPDVSTANVREFLTFTELTNARKSEQSNA